MQIRGNYLFNITASYGCGVLHKPDFPELSDLLRHMDRLGIDGAAVMNVMARDFQPTPGNKKLIEDIENTPNAKNRLLPVFCVAPAMYYNRTEREYLIEMVSSGRVKILAAAHKMQGFSMRQIGRLFEELRPYKPAVLVETGGTDLAEVDKLAYDFPEMFFIMQTFFWSGMSIADLMWRCPNVGIETSWLFSAAGLKIIVDNFGPERVFFGADTKNQQASSIAGLEYADISGEAYKLISGGNAEKLLRGVAGADIVFSSKCSPARFGNSLWQPFIERRGLRGEMIIDAHAHSGAFMPGCYTDYFDETDSFEYMAHYMERIGVEKTVASSIGAL